MPLATVGVTCVRQFGSYLPGRSKDKKDLALVREDWAESTTGGRVV